MQKKPSETRDAQFPLNTDYPKKDDIYNRAEKRPVEEDDVTGKLITDPQKPRPTMGLDVPGAELDDADEIIGEEDEENNYYSLGGDNHENLEEDKGE